VSIKIDRDLQKQIPPKRNIKEKRDLMKLTGSGTAWNVPAPLYPWSRQCRAMPNSGCSARPKVQHSTGRLRREERKEKR